MWRIRVVGLGISYLEVELTLDSSLYAVEDATLEESQFGPNRFRPERRVVTGIIVFERFQIDLGADLSDLVDRVALSAIYSF